MSAQPTRSAGASHQIRSIYGLSGTKIGLSAGSILNPKQNT
jgi:hypothetical protein